MSQVSASCNTLKGLSNSVNNMEPRVTDLEKVQKNHGNVIKELQDQLQSMMGEPINYQYSLPLPTS